MAVKDLLEMSASQLSALEGAELRRAFKSVSASLRMRRQAFVKHGSLSGMPEKYRGGIRKAGSFDTEAEMRAYMRQGLAYMRGKVSTYKGYEESRQKRKEHLEKITGHTFSSMAEYNRWGNFMGEMQERLKASWKAVSNLAWELYDEADRLNLEPEQLMKNFEYWADHLEDLKEAEPLKRNRNLRPSDYLKALKLENISTYYADELKQLMDDGISEQKAKEDIRRYSSSARKPSRGRKAKQGRKGR